MTAKGSSPHGGVDTVAKASALFDVVDLPAAGMPVSFAIALPGQALLRIAGVPAAAMPDAGRMASGRGLDPEESRKSCLGEAAELFSCCEWGDESLVSATADEIGPAAILPDALNGFGQSQRHAPWNRLNGSFDWRSPASPPTRKIDWLAVDDAFGGKPAYIPADFAFIGRRQAGDGKAVAIGDSNGCAAGPNADAAKLDAILELVERDATGRWWYGRRLRPPVDPACLRGALAEFLAGRARMTRFFDITTDIGIPVIAAASAEADGSDVALGFAAGLGADAAATAAVTEMLQMEVSLTAARLMGEAAGAWSLWLAEVSMATPPLSAAGAVSTAPGGPSRGGIRGEDSSAQAGFVGASAASNLATALDALAAQGIDLWFADMTRPEIGVPVFRAVSAALCHYKPRFGKPRLLAPDARDIGRATPAEQPLLLI